MSAFWVALLYGRTLHAPFVYDDVLTVQHNPHLSSWRDIIWYFRSPVDLNSEYRGQAGAIYRPLTWLGFIVNRWFSDNSPVGFHLTNLAFHWANGALGFLLLRKFRIGPVLAGATCLVWLGLPINTEAVAWVSGRHTCQATCFILVSLLAAMRYSETRRGVLMAAYAAAFLGALLSNEWGVLALPLTALCIYSAGVRDRRTWLYLSASGVGVTALELAMRRMTGAHLPLGSLKLWPVGPALLKYLSWMVLPVRMSVERSTDTPPDAMTLDAVAALAGILGFFGFVIFWLRQQAPRMAAGLAWISISLLPFCGVVFIYQGMAERYCYLASAGFAFSAVTLLDRMRGSFRPVALAVLIVWVGWGAWRLNARVTDWEDETTLFQSSLQVNPRSQILLYDLGVKAAEAGDLADAVAYYRQALEVNPKYVNVLVNLGNILRNQGSYSEALQLEQRAVAADPKSADLWVDLGDTYLRQGSLDEAERSYRRAIGLDGQNVAAIVDLGAALQGQGQFQDAERQYRTAMVIAPQQGAAYCNLGALLLKQGDVNGAVQQFQSAVQHDGSYSTAYFDLGLVYESAGRNELAKSMFEKVLELMPQNTEAAVRLQRLKGPSVRDRALQPRLRPRL